MKYFVELPEVWATEFLEDDPSCNGYWISSLTQSWQKGYPDNCSLPWSHYVELVRRLRMHTQKEIMVDVDMLFNEPSLDALIAKELYEAGANSIVIESKKFPKVNSLTPDHMVVNTPEEFARMINKVKTSVPDLGVIARLEYLALTKDIDHTYRVSKRMLNAGADSIVIHWGGSDDTSYLKEALSLLKKDKVNTGIIPTQYLDQVVNGDFNKLADFSILGNICSSFIRYSYAQKSVEDLLKLPCEFKPLLERSSSHEPEGKRTLIVLGAKPNKKGEYLLGSTEVVNKFLENSSAFYSVLLVTSAEVKIPNNINQKKVRQIKIQDSMGEAHSLSLALSYLNTEMVTVAYADIEDIAFNNLDGSGILFQEDKFMGVLNTNSDLLFSLVNSCDPSSSILELASGADINPNVLR